MIIGIAGKAGSGKDLVGSIIQYLIDSAQFNYKISEQNYNDYLKNKHDLKSYWKIVKFADKLKDIVCLLIGCTREQLEDREFKEKELKEEWWQYGLLRKGMKKPILFPSKLEDIKDQLKVFEGSTLYIDKLTPRKLLQLLGTECGRQIIHPNIWVNATFAEYKPLYTQYGNVDHYYNLGNCKYECRYKGDYFELTNGSVEKTKSEDELISLNAAKVYYEHPNWIISDVRFPNETKAVKDKNGILIRLNRNVGLESKHESETALDNYNDWDYIIENNGTIEDLIKKVKEILIKEKII